MGSSAPPFSAQALRPGLRLGLCKGASVVSRDRCCSGDTVLLCGEPITGRFSHKKQLERNASSTYWTARVQSIWTCMKDASKANALGNKALPIKAMQELKLRMQLQMLPQMHSTILKLLLQLSAAARIVH